MPIEFHKMIHGKGTRGQGWGPGGPWNFQWRAFFEDKPLATAEDIFKFKDNLLKRISDRTVTSSKDIKWRFYPQK
jgi:hypothetical protein